MSEFRISQITKKKIDSVKGMLAPEIVSAVEKDLPVTALAVVEDDTVIGALGGAADNDCFEIVSVYVVPDKRRRGAGTALLEKVFELADAEELMVRAEYTPMDSEGKTIEPFLTAMDFMKERIIFPLYQADTIDNISWDSASLPGSRAEIMIFAEVSETLLSEALSRSKEDEGMLGCVEELINIIDKSMSFLAMEKGELKGCVLAERLSGGTIELSPIWSEESDTRDMKLMLSFALDEIRASCPPDTNIIIPAMDHESLEIVEEIFGTSATVTLGFIKSSFASLRR